ncbi:hypothetical protein BS78_07G102700 [Paspalum vaginatum]|nr:hypothetical protein BS78_07G102700 [Paspalum vaginatum]
MLLDTCAFNPTARCPRWATTSSHSALLWPLELALTIADPRLPERTFSPS